MWLRVSQPNPNARLRLFCFPYAGGAASIYRTWPQHLPADIEVCAVQLPGRENRIREAPFTDVAALVQALIPHMDPYLDKPFALFGHSMGTIIAYGLAQQLCQRHGPMPTHLLVSGRRAPMLPETEPPLHTIPDDGAFLVALQRRYNNVPALLFKDPELRELFVRLLRADFTLVERYQYAETAPLPCPIIAFDGIADQRTSQATLLAWQPLTAHTFDLHFFPGGHFYLNEQTGPLVTMIAHYLSIGIA